MAHRAGCQHAFGPADAYCPGCHQYRGVPCHACGASLAPRQAACGCGGLTGAPQWLLDWARSTRPAPQPDGPGAMPRRVHLAPVRRVFPVVLEQLLAVDEAEVRRLIGEPDNRGSGSPGPAPSFGLQPNGVPRDLITATWSYHNIDDSMWVLWWVGSGDEARVGEVASASAEAVF